MSWINFFNSTESIVLPEGRLETNDLAGGLVKATMTMVVVDDRGYPYWILL